MKLYRATYHGIGINSGGKYWPLSTYFEADNDNAAIQAAARPSSAINCSHSVTIEECNGIMPVRTVHDRVCGANESW